MEKYGVEEEIVPGKTASEDPPCCPDCGTKLEDKLLTGILICPKCGSKPFEK